MKPITIFIVITLVYAYAISITALGTAGVYVWKLMDNFLDWLWDKIGL